MILKHSGKVMRHHGKILKHHARHSGGSIKHLVHHAHGGNVSALKNALQKMTIKPKKHVRIKF